MINYKQWLFRMFVYSLVLFVVAFFLGLNMSALLVDEYHPDYRNILILDTGRIICMLAGLIFLVLCARNNQLNDRRTWVSAIGLVLLFLLNVLSFFVNLAAAAA